MSGYVPSRDLVPRVGNGEVPAIARMISRAESGMPEAREALAEIYRRAGGAHVIGMTGVPGSGKSTLVSTLTARLRAKGSKVGIVAIDPSSPYSGGSILGDRIRMFRYRHHRNGRRGAGRSRDRESVRHDRRRLGARPRR
jgi:LAO/AO transport system kinase